MPNNENAANIICFLDKYNLIVIFSWLHKHMHTHKNHIIIKEEVVINMKGLG